jgi:hypothetical protein
MISLSDDELQILMSAAKPLQPQQRDQFLRDVAEALAVNPLPAGSYS